MNKEIWDKLIDFREKRNWDKYHTPEELARSLMIESAELNRLFQWGEEWQDKQTWPPHRVKLITEELADIGIYLTYLCIEYGIDINQAIHDKIEKNAIKYPVDNIQK
jgi:NTP pyrophosphatase (non-canonical NTP hydrolase)